ncbi:hypothetical protein I548_5679 [Mycobacterium intracellulare]|nr:hypothetical protein I548_5679 [Mycobacterium intracellulare]
MPARGGVRLTAGSVRDHPGVRAGAATPAAPGIGGRSRGPRSGCRSG